MTIQTYWIDNVSDDKITDRMYPYLNEAFRTVESEAYNGNPDFQYLLGRIYINGIIRLGSTYSRMYSIKPDTVKAIYWWNEAAKQKYILAYNKMQYSV